ncbi:MULTISPECIES: Insertion element protein [Thermomonosporaceae]|uniref:Insertion element protein n=1 Tax=Thermomonosporaceae TaxID=2012 RepID=UPI00255B1785|nr:MULTISPECIES: Insertion element protein [Thermomonosporaceae]MDL4774759.1 Insertion element protein [Actinomadura xylanilytica]
MSERAAPFYCPYCGEEHLEPREEAGAWFCHDCVRSFSLKFLGVGAPRTHKEDPR